jgi:hypothetical protein
MMSGKVRLSHFNHKLFTLNARHSIDFAFAMPVISKKRSLTIPVPNVVLRFKIFIR